MNKLNTATTGNNSLTWDSLKKTYELLLSYRPKVYYCLSEYVPDVAMLYQVPVYGVNVIFLHPDLFPKFQLEVGMVELVDFRTVAQDLAKHFFWIRWGNG